MVFLSELGFVGLLDEPTFFFLQNPLHPKNPGSGNSLAVQAFFDKKAE